MSNVEKFQELLRSDEGLQAKLRTATETYQGDKTDEAAVFDAVVAPLAAGVGLPFTYEEAKAFAEEDREVSLDDADAIAGGEDVASYGWSGCIIVGGGNENDVTACVMDENTGGAGACEYVGFGIFIWN